MTNHTFHVYASSPDDGRVHYVGQTFKITDRFKQQVALARRRVGYGPHCATIDRRERWLCDLARRDLEPILARAVSLTPGPAPVFPPRRFPLRKDGARRNVGSRIAPFGFVKPPYNKGKPKE